MLISVVSQNIHYLFPHYMN